MDHILDHHLDDHFPILFHIFPMPFHGNDGNLKGVGHSQVVLEFQSNWLASGARLDIQELRAGYAEVPQDAQGRR